MYNYLVKVEGMGCPKCEARINRAIEAAFKVKSVSSSHKKGETCIESEVELSQDAITKVIEEEGYTVLSIS